MGLIFTYNIFLNKNMLKISRVLYSRGSWFRVNTVLWNFFIIYVTQCLLSFGVSYIYTSQINQTNMEGEQSGTYLRLTSASSGLQVSVAKTCRDETKRKWVFQPDHSGLPPVFYCWGRPLWSGWNINFCFISSLYVLATLTHGPDDALVSLR